MTSYFQNFRPSILGLNFLIFLGILYLPCLDLNIFGLGAGLCPVCSNTTSTLLMLNKKKSIIIIMLLGH